MMRSMNQYMACVNLTINDAKTFGVMTPQGDIFENVEQHKVHICNFIPLVIGSIVDIRLRYGL